MSKAFASHDVAQRYDSARALPDETSALWMDTLRDLLPCGSVSSILDLGAGTGRFSAPLHEAFSCPVIAVDPSEAMIEQARSRGLAGVTCRVGSAEGIPLEDHSVDLVWMSQAFHHLESVPAALREIRRVLKPGGHLAIRNSTPESNAEIEYLRCFPEAQQIDDARLPSRQDLLNRVCELGFQSVAVKTVYQVFASSYEEYYNKISQRALSTLIAISDEAFAAGLQRLRHWADEQPKEQPGTEPIDLFVFRVSGSLTNTPVFRDLSGARRNGNPETRSADD